MKKMSKEVKLVKDAYVCGETGFRLICKESIEGKPFKKEIAKKYLEKKEEK